MINDEFTPASVLDYANTKYKKRLFDWLFIRDAIEGESAIKFKNELYLPMPTAMVDFTPPAVSAPAGYYTQFWADDFLRQIFTDHNPNYHRNPAYSAYMTRAEFPEIPGYVLRGLIGLALKELPSIELPSELSYLETKATAQGMSLIDYFSYLLQEVLSTGRAITTFDIDPNGNIYFVAYKAEDCINWQYSDDSGEDRRVTAVRLVEMLDDSFDEPKEWSEKNCAIVELRLINGKYMVKKAYSKSELEEGWVTYKEDEDIFEIAPSVSFPNVAGITLEELPVIAIGSLNNEFDIDPSPMYPIANASRHIYMKSADLSQSEYMSCSPMLVLTGVSQDSAPKAIGSTVSLAIPNPEAKVFYTQTDTSALSHVKRHMEDLYTRAIQSGAQLLDTSPKPAETAETTRLKQAASTATLLTAVRNVASAIEKQLKQIAKLKGVDEDSIQFIPNTEFIAPMITAAEIRELVQSWVNGALSKVTLLENFRRAGIIDETKTVEDEIKLLEEEEAELQPGSVKFNRLKALFEKDRGGLGKSRSDMTPSDQNIDNPSE